MAIEPEHPKEEGASTSYTGSLTGRLFRDDARFALKRITAFQYGVVLVFLFLLTGFWYLQVYNHEANSELAERNRIKTVPVPAPRGKILDRDGRIIVDNHSSFSLFISQETLDPAHLPLIAQALHLDLAELKATVAKFAKGPKYIPIPIKTELTADELAFVESHRDPDSFPELELLEAQKRLYPLDGLAAHVLGYVGQVSEAELNSAEFARFSRGDTIGKFGLERQYNDLLTGVDGQRRVVVDVTGREREVLESQEAKPGQNLQLTLDLDLQAVAELEMDGRRGAVVALDPRNGDVLAMVSRPAFDPNIFGRPLRQAEWDAVNKNPNTPMMNRAIQGTYAPGSTFKPIVAIAGLETGNLDTSETVNCSGAANWYGNLFHCHSKHGVTDLHRGMVQSCDVFFYRAGDRIGIDGIAQYAQVAGLGEATGIDLPGEKDGLIPSTKWKLRTQRERWYPGETISVSIGQGAVEVTPLQLAHSIGGLANGGRWFQPHVVKLAGQQDPKRIGNWDPLNIASIVSGMYGVVNEGGTGTAAAIPGVTVSGKTGSAQRISNALAKSNRALAEEFPDNGWFVGFAPRDNPEIVIAVIVEAGIHGGQNAAPITRKILKTYFDKQTRNARPNPTDIAGMLQLKR